MFLLCNTDQQQTARKFRSLPLQAKKQTWAIIAWHHKSEPGSRAVCGSYRQTSCHRKK